VAFELLGDKLREARQRALAHLRARDADDDGVVRTDHHPGIDLRRAVGGTDHPRFAQGKIEAERQPAASGGCAHPKASTIYFWLVIHSSLRHHAFAAAWIAARPCWYVPQRQILVMLASMSASVGSGFSLSSAATAMIMPDWQ